jgi:hypothetical protein
MAKIYSLPEEFEKKLPVIDFSTPVLDWEKADEAFIKELKEWAIKRNPAQEYVGEVIYFPVADGYAQYMVVATKLVELIHLPLGDAWEFQYASKMTKKDIAQKIKSEKAMDELFSKNKTK